MVPTPIPSLIPDLSLPRLTHTSMLPLTVMKASLKKTKTAAAAGTASSRHSLTSTTTLNQLGERSSHRAAIL